MRTLAIKKTRVMTLALASLVFSTTAMESQAQILIRGASSCGQWISERDNVKLSVNQFWLLGFLSEVAYGIDEDFVK